MLKLVKEVIASEPAGRSSGILGRIFWALALAFSFWHIYVAFAGPIGTIQQRSLFIGLSIILGFGFYPVSKKRPNEPILWWEVVAIVATCFLTAFFFIHDLRILEFPKFIHWYDLWLSFILFITILEATRRVMGIVIPIVVLIFLLYCLLGHYIPGALGHREMSFTFVMENLFWTAEGIWGFLAGVMTRVVAIFIIFGSLAMRCGLGKILIDLVIAIGGSGMGGAAKVACLASGGFGSISGSPVANVVVTGSFTIPMMKNLGYQPEFAAAAESSASSGGLIMPPIMGVAAFIIAEITGIPYARIIITAFLPAVMFYYCIWMSIHFYSLKNQLKGVPKDQVPPLRPLFNISKVPRLALPVVVLLTMLYTGWSISMAGFWASMAIIIPYLFLDFKKAGIAKRLEDILKGIAEGGQNLIMLGVIAGACGIIINLATITPIIYIFSNAILGATGGVTVAVLFVVMFLCIIFGMGMPVTAAYVVTIAIAGGMMLELGFDLLASHLFILYFAVMSNITPPICIVVLVAAPMAGANWLGTARMAVMLAAAGFIVPFIFIYSPGMLLAAPLPEILLAFLSTAGGITCLAALFMQYLKTSTSIYESVLLFIAAILFLFPGFVTTLIALIPFLLVVGLQWRRLKYTKTSSIMNSSSQSNTNGT